MDEKPTVRFIWHDYGNVLWMHHSDRLWEEIGHLGRPKRSAHEVLALVRKHGLISLYDGGEINTDNFIERMDELFHFSDKERFVYVWRTRALSPNALMWGVVRALSRNGMPQGVISNINEYQATNIERSLGCGMIMTLSPRIYSYRVHSLKPEQRIYEISLEAANAERQFDPPLQAEECVLIDDRPENIDSFNRFGGTGILHNPVAQTATIECLASMNILPWTQLQ